MIRPVRRDELDKLQAIAKTTFVETFASDNSPEDLSLYRAQSLTLEALGREFENPLSSFFFVELTGKIGGYLKLNEGAAQTDSVLQNAIEIERIYVLSDMQGRGLGKALFDFSINEAKIRNKKWLWLGVWEHNKKAIEFYKRQGLTIFGDHDFLFGHTTQRDLLMRLDLR